MNNREIFLAASESKAFDAEHRRKIDFNISRYDNMVLKGKKQYANLELARQAAAAVKRKTIEYLDRYLMEFEANFTRRGGKVIWAKDAEEAAKEILGILKRTKARLVVKSKSMATEEIHLNETLENNGIEPVETDLGEYIVQIAGEKPYHIVTPAMHKSKEDVAKLFNEEFGTPVDFTPQQIAGFVREKLRKKYLKADAGITGANFLVADTGSIAVTENEGNALMSVSFPKIHIAICGIEKVIPSVNDLDLFWCLLATHGTGQRVTVYNTILSGPGQPDEKDGPVEMYVVLLDNGRTDLLASALQRPALTCIRCGACLNACPVYKTIGGHSYQTVYSGPIGSVITPYMRGFSGWNHLSFASSLCGKCTEVCPVKIEIHKLLLFNRRDTVKNGLSPVMEKLMMIFWKKIMMNRWCIDALNGKIKNILLKRFFRKSWGARRELPKAASNSFSAMWKNQTNHCFTSLNSKYKANTKASMVSDKVKTGNFNAK